ncbi:MAG: ABC transporter ATP-binding protein [Egibacteraceae bacterium]
MGHEPAIEVVSVSKRIKGRTILDDVSLTVAPGEVVGFIGPNGAGKTTLIRLLSGMARPSSGSIRVLGQPVDGRGAGPDGLGLLVESLGFVEHASGRRNLLLLASIRGRLSASEVDAAMREVGLDPRDRRPVAKYSLGMRQRLGLAQALMERPRVLLLDEPTNGLDVVGIAGLRDTIRQQASDGVAVFLASHLLSEVELASDRVLIVVRGRILQELSTHELHAAENGIRVRVATPGQWQKVAAAFTVAPLADDHETSGLVIDDLPVPDLVRALVAMKLDVEEVAPHRASLEETFFQRVGAEAS